MNLTLTPASLNGMITPPPSKSQLHRLVIASALADGESVIENVILSDDLRATLAGMEALGATTRHDGSTLYITGIPSEKKYSDLPRIHCGASGSTLRFLIPIALAVAGGGVFTGDQRLMERPLQPYFDLFDEKNIAYTLENNTLTVRGRLPAGEYRLPGNVSSQFFSGLLFALPLLNSPSVLIPTGPLESFGYILMTLQALDEFGITIPATCSLPPQYHIPAPAQYHPHCVKVEADWSQAAFWYAAEALGNAVTVCGMEEASLQGDRVFPEFAARIREGGSVSIDISDCPDLAPPLSALGALMEGTLHLTNAARLRTKESDRLSAITHTLSALGADIQEESDALTIRGRKQLSGGVTVDCCNDHRIAMMLAIIATRCAAPITLTGAQCVNKSYPHFWKDYTVLGGIVHEHTGQ